MTNKSLSVTKTQSKTNIDNNSILLNNKIYNFFIFNKSGMCVLEKQFEEIFKDSEEYNNYKLFIKNISHTILINNEKKKSQSTNSIDENDDDGKLSLNNNKKDSKGNEFIFKNIQLEKCKILFMLRNNIIFVSTFPIRSTIQFQRLLLIHIFIALINFKGDAITAMNKLNEYEQYNKNNFINLKTFYNKKLKLQSKEINDVLELLIFENYFLKIIIVHFSKVFNELFKKEYLKLNQTRFKNLYILDLATSSIILDMVKIQGNKEPSKKRNYIINNKLFDEILFHAKNMYNNYKSENDMKYVAADSIYRFVKFECTSTFPRLLFIIKFIPVLNGIAVIHLYYQKKLSRNTEDNPLDQELKYKEIDLLFGSFIRDNQNLEFKYGAPKKLQHIEKFFEEFFITNRNGFDIFRTNLNKKFKYVNYYIINIINSVPVSNKIDIELLFQDINKRLEEEYNKDLNTKREKELLRQEINSKSKSKDNDENEDENDNEEENENTENSYDNIFILNKDTVYNEIIDIKNKDLKIEIKPKNMNKKQVSNIFPDSIIKSLISEEDKKDRDIMENNKTFKNNIKNNEINSNLNIDNLIYTENNSERKNLLIKKNKNFSNLSKISDSENFSLISEVKSKEKFKIKVLNIKSQQIRDKKNYIYNNLSKEKDYNLSELLEDTELNQKNYTYIEQKESKKNINIQKDKDKDKEKDNNLNNNHNIIESENLVLESYTKK